MASKNFFAQLEAISAAAQKLPRIVGAVAVDFSMDRFRARNWIGNSTQNWPKRKERSRWGKTPRNKGRALLIDKGYMRRSIRVTSATQEQVVIQVAAPYGAVHNEGFRGQVKQQVSAHTRKRMRAARTKTGKDSKTKKEVAKTWKVKAHSRTIRQNIPQRRFLGNSPYLTKKIEREITAQFMKALK